MCFLMKNLPCAFFLALYVLHGSSHETSNPFHTRFLRSSTTGCLLPPYPENGNWSILDSSFANLSPNMTLPSGRFILISCNENYTLDGDRTRICKRDKWTKDQARCIKKCSPLPTSPHQNVKCFDKNNKPNKCSEAGEGSHAEFSCHRFYEIKNVTTVRCSDGTWKGKAPECILACGKNKFIDPSMVINGSNATKGAQPWQVAIYDTKTKELICGGSLLNQRVILTAAHCVSINGYDAKTAISLVVDNYYSQYNHSKDKSAQFASVLEIFLPERYQGREQNYKNDIAVIVTKETFTLTENVQPICIDWNSEYLEEATKSFNNGFVTGWGYTEEDGEPAAILQELTVRPVDYTSCFDSLSHGFRKYLTRDKLCAGHLNKSMAVCKGDSGGGLIFKHGSRFYVSALVSVAPGSSRALTESCDSQQYSLYTNISYHRKFIADKLAWALGLKDDEAISQRSNYALYATLNPEKCRLPEHPQFGYWSINEAFEQYDASPGKFIKSGTRLKVDCYNNYSLKGSNYLKCEDGSWNSTIGQCLRTCPNVYSTKTMKVRCTYLDGSISSDKCVKAIDGTITHFECAPFYEDFSLRRNPIRVCMNGKWDETLPECSPVCGIIDDDIKRKNVFPWHVAIYSSTTKHIICSGSLINERVVITAAYCVTDDAHALKPKDSLLVTVGGRSRVFNHTRDSQQIQISEVNSIYKPESDKGQSNQGQDIAIIVTKKTFKLTKRVLPVCLGRLMISDGSSDNTYLYVSGWGYDMEKGEHPELLKLIKIPRNLLTGCENLVRRRTSSTEDKLCVRYIHNSSMICYGDVGRGLVSRQDDRYYLDGVLNFGVNSPTSVGTCDRQEFGVYTKPSSYLMTFILRVEAEFRLTWKTSEFLL